MSRIINILKSYYVNCFHDTSRVPHHTLREAVEELESLIRSNTILLSITKLREELATARDLNPFSQQVRSLSDQLCEERNSHAGTRSALDAAVRLQHETSVSLDESLKNFITLQGQLDAERRERIAAKTVADAKVEPTPVNKAIYEPTMFFRTSNSCLQQWVWLFENHTPLEVVREHLREGRDLINHGGAWKFIASRKMFEEPLVKESIEPSLNNRAGVKENPEAKQWPTAYLRTRLVPESFITVRKFEQWVWVGSYPSLPTEADVEALRKGEWIAGGAWIAVPEIK